MPQWGWLDGMEDAHFVRESVKHFGIGSVTSQYNASYFAGRIYFADLLRNGLIDKAVEIMNRWESEPDIVHANYSQEVPFRSAALIWKPIQELQRRLPARDLWENYVGAALVSGHAKVAADRIEAVLRQPDVKSALRQTLLEHLITLHGSLGDIHAVLKDYRDAMSTQSA